MDAPLRISGPLKTWYDLHEAIDHESAPEVWADVETRMPELAALAGPQR